MAVATKKPSRTVTLNSRQHEQLREYQEITGVPIAKCVREALEDWIECCAATQLESIAQKSGHA